MNIREFIDLLPPGARMEAYKSLALAHGRPESTIYHWARKGTHPAVDECMRITEEWSQYRVTRFSERPDAYPIDSLVKVLREIGYRVEKQSNLGELNE